MPSFDELSARFAAELPGYRFSMFRSGGVDYARVRRQGQTFSLCHPGASREAALERAIRQTLDYERTVAEPLRSCTRCQGLGQYVSVRGMVNCNHEKETAG